MWLGVSSVHRHRGPTGHLWMLPKAFTLLVFLFRISCRVWFFAWLSIRPRAVGTQKANNEVAWWNAARSLASAFQWPAGIWASRHTKVCLFGRIVPILCIQNAFEFFRWPYSAPCSARLMLVIEIKAYSGHFYLKLSLKIVRKASCWSPTQPIFPPALGLMLFLCWAPEEASDF